MEQTYSRKRFTPGSGCLIKKGIARKMIRHQSPEEPSPTKTSPTQTSPTKTTPTKTSPTKITHTKTTPTPNQADATPSKNGASPRVTIASPGPSPSYKHCSNIRLLDWPVPTSPGGLSKMYKRAKDEATYLKSEVRELLGRLVNCSNEQHVANMLLLDEPLLVLYDMLLEMEEEIDGGNKVKGILKVGSAIPTEIITIADSTT